MEGEDSIEPDYQTLEAIIQELGFEFESEKTSMPCIYSQNQISMLLLILQRSNHELLYARALLMTYNCLSSSNCSSLVWRIVSG